MLIQSLSLFVWAVKTEYHRLGDLHQQEFISPVLEAGRPKTKAPAGLASGEGLLSCPDASSPCVLAARGRGAVWGLSVKDSALVTASVPGGPTSKNHHSRG